MVKRLKEEKISSFPSVAARLTTRFVVIRTSWCYEVPTVAPVHGLTWLPVDDDKYGAGRSLWKLHGGVWVLELSSCQELLGWINHVGVMVILGDHWSFNGENYPLLEIYDDFRE